jgi:hypothetical protein
MKYEASYDKLVIIISVAVNLLLGAIFVLILICIPRDNSEIVLKTLILIFLITVPVITFLFSPVEYSIDEEYIKIKRIMSSVSVNYNDIINISIPDEKLMKKSCRSGGVGGLFGYYGNFYNKKIGGDMKWYATQMKKFVIIKAKKVKKDNAGPYSGKFNVIVLTPDKYLDFVNELKMKLKEQSEAYKYGLADLK